MEAYSYRIFKGKWGISITIYGEVKCIEPDNKCEKIANNIYVMYSDKPLKESELFCEEDRVAISKGILAVSNNIMNKIKSEKIVVEVCGLEYSLCYYQPEAMTVAMMNWCAKVFGFNEPEITYEFDHEHNKYVFNL